MGSLTYIPARSSPCVLHAPWTSTRWQAFLLAFLLPLTVRWVGAVPNPHNNFCRRYGHQTTLVDDKLYIDGGWIDFDTFPTDQVDYASKQVGDFFNERKKIK